MWTRAVPDMAIHRSSRYVISFVQHVDILMIFERGWKTMYRRWTDGRREAAVNAAAFRVRVRSLGEVGNKISNLI